MSLAMIAINKTMDYFIARIIYYTTLKNLERKVFFIVIVFG